MPDAERRSLLAALALLPLATRNGVARARVFASLGYGLEVFGAVGDGVTDDTAAINRALVASARSGLRVTGRRGATYLVSPQRQKAFLSPAGTTYVAPAGIEVPSGASIDFGGARLCAREPVVLISNMQTAGVGDRITVTNLVVDGTGTHAAPAAFMGCRNSTFGGLRFINTTENAALFAALADCSLDQLSAENIVGNAITLGGNTAYQLVRCRIGDLFVRDVRGLGTVHQPGNPFLVGARDSSFGSLTARNCGGGIKFTANCTRLTVGSTDFDGNPDDGATRMPLDRGGSGTKVQGGDDEPAIDIRIDRIVSRHCQGQGLYIRNVRNLTIGSYVGTDNGALALSPDIDCDRFDRISIGSVVSENAGQLPIQIGRLAGTLRARTVHIVKTRPFNGRFDGIVALGGTTQFDSTAIETPAGTDPNDAAARLANDANPGSRLSIDGLDRRVGSSTISKKLWQVQRPGAFVLPRGVLSPAGGDDTDRGSP